MSPRAAALFTVASLAVTAPALAQIAPTNPSPGQEQPATPPAAGSVAPRLQQFVQATYPPEALAQGLDAQVVLQLTLDAEGHVTDATVVTPAGHGFDEAALEAARRFQFSPGMRDGVAVPSVLRYRYRFSSAAARAAQEPARPHAVLRGVVRAAGERPLMGATVTVTLSDGRDRTATTAGDGSFRFEVDVVGPARVAVRAAGMQDLTADETLADRDDVSLVYRLTERPAEAPAAPARGAASEDPDVAGEVTIRGRRPAREVTRQTLEFREILRMPGTGGDALRAVQNFPGVARSLTGLLIVRGATPQDTQIFVDGTNVPIVYHFGGLSSVVNTEFLDRIDFYPGNYSARYGRAQAGIVDVGLRQPRRQGWRLVANVNLIEASLFVEGAITPNLSFAASLRRSYVDAVLGAVLSNIDTVTITSLPVYWDYQAMLDWRPTTRDRLRLTFLGSDDTFAIILNRPNEMAPRFSGSFSSGIGFHTGQLLWDHTFSRATSSRAMVSLGRNALNFGGGDAFGLDLSFWQYTARYELTHQIDRHVRVNLGLDMTGGPATTTFNGFRPPTEGQTVGAFTSAPRVATQATSVLYRPGAYAELEVTPSDRLRLVPSVRVDYTRDADRNVAVQPRMSFRWEFLRDWFVKGGVGVYNQPPQPNQSSDAQNSFQPGATIGNPFLRPQRAVQYGLGLEHNFSRYVSLSVEGFYKDLDEQVVSGQTITGVPYSNIGAGRIYGGEILFRHRPSSRFFGWVAYTISRSERRDGPGLPYRIFQFDQTHILTVIASYRLGRGWEVGARFRLVSGNPTTPIAGSVLNGDSGTYLQVPGATYSSRVDAFHQLDLRIDKTWTFSRGNLDLYLEVLNVYNHTNPEGVQYNYNFTQSQTVGGLPIFPNLGVRFEY